MKSIIAFLYLALLFIKPFYCDYYDQYFELCKSIPSDSNLTLLTTLNGKIRGQCLTVPVSYSNGSKISNNVLRFLSIPYAQPPIGQNRFKSPIPASSWENVRNGTNWPNRCMQFDSSANQLPKSEDCLYLNIFVPADSYLNRNQYLTPIFVFIHGGSFTGGSSTDDRFEASTLVSMKGIIVVTLNYRVDAFGFMAISGSDATGNQGFLDQSLALKWIYENAYTFGGDNSKITLSGESAGAWSVGYHLFYPKSWPYFRNAILQSGGPTYKGFSTCYKSKF